MKTISLILSILTAITSVVLLVMTFIEPEMSIASKYYFTGFLLLIGSIALFGMYRAEYWRQKYYDALGLNTRTGELEEETDHLRITKNGVLIDGHHRMEAMRRLNEDS